MVFFQRLQDLTFFCKCLPGGDPFRNADGVTAAGLAVTAHQHIIRCVQKQDLIGDPLLIQLLQPLLDLLFAAASADIHG